LRIILCYTCKKFKTFKKVPKSDLGFWVKSQSRLKDKARGNFATQPYMVNTVRSKIDDNAVFQDESAILNSAKAELGEGYMAEDFRITKIASQIVSAKETRLKAQIDTGVKKAALNQQKKGGSNLIKLIKGSKIDIKI